MFQYKKVFFCLTMITHFVSADFNTPLRQEGDVKSEMIELLKTGPTTSAQRTADGLLKVTLSEEAQKRREKLVVEVSRLVSDHLQTQVKEFMSEIDPEDAKNLLPLIDKFEKLSLRLISGLGKKMSPEETELYKAQLRLDLANLLYDCMPYLLAIEKSENIGCAHVQERQLIAQSLGNVLNSYRKIRAMVEEKARS